MIARIAQICDQRLSCVGMETACLVLPVIFAFIIYFVNNFFYVGKIALPAIFALPAILAFKIESFLSLR